MFSSQAWRITFVWARFNGLDPFLSIGDFDTVMDFCVEFLYLWARRGRGAEGSFFNNESFGSFSEVRYHVRDVTLGGCDLGGCGVLRRRLGFWVRTERTNPPQHRRLPRDRMDKIPESQPGQLIVLLCCNTFHSSARTDSFMRASLFYMFYFIYTFFIF